MAAARNSTERKGRPIASLIVRVGETVLQALPLVKDVILIGRHDEADICLIRPGISRCHARVVKTPEGGYRVEDMESHNGTFVGDEKITARALNPGDIFRVSDCAIQFTDETVEEKRPAARPAPVELDVGAVTARAKVTMQEGPDEEFLDALREKQKAVLQSDAPASSETAASGSPAAVPAPPPPSASSSSDNTVWIVVAVAALAVLAAAAFFLKG